MPDFINTDSNTRVWTGLSHPGNDRRPQFSTLELDAGEVVEGLVVPWGFEDPWLKPLEVGYPDQAPPQPEVPSEPPPAEEEPPSDDPSEEG